MTCLRGELERDMLLMGCRSIAELNPSCIAARNSGPGSPW